MTEADINRILQETKTRYPGAYQVAHREGDPRRYDFIILATRALINAFGLASIGGNWRRGAQGDLSMDGVSVNIDGEWRFADVIGGAGGPNPTLGYRTPGPEARLMNGANPPQYIGAAGVADTRAIPTSGSYNPVEPPTGQVCPDPSAHLPKVKPPYQGDGFWVEHFGRIYMDDITRAGQTPNAGSWIWAGRVNYDHYIGGMPIEEAVKKHREGPGGWLDALGLS